MKKSVLVTVVTLLFVLGLVAAAHLVNFADLVRHVHGG